VFGLFKLTGSLLVYFMTQHLLLEFLHGARCEVVAGIVAAFVQSRLPIDRLAVVKTVVSKQSQAFGWIIAIDAAS
jgi:hypothetical protein